MTDRPGDRPVTQIPPDHEASRDLYDAFARLGREQASAAPAEPVARPRRRRRALVLVPIVVLSAVTAAGAARVLTDDGAPIRAEKELPSFLRQAPDATLAAARDADPDGRLPWGVRIYLSAKGGHCAQAGQVKDGRLGRLDGRSFLPFARDAPGNCGLPGAHTVVLGAQSPRPDKTGLRSIVYGWVDRTVRSVEVVGDGPRRRIPVAGDGSFVDASATRLRGTVVVRTADRTFRTFLRK